MVYIRSFRLHRMCRACVWVRLCVSHTVCSLLSRISVCMHFQLYNKCTIAAIRLLFWTFCSMFTKCERVLLLFSIQQHSLYIYALQCAYAIKPMWNKNGGCFLIRFEKFEEEKTVSIEQALVSIINRLNKIRFLVSINHTRTHAYRCGILAVVVFWSLILFGCVLFIWVSISWENSFKEEIERLLSRACSLSCQPFLLYSPLLFLSLTVAVAAVAAAIYLSHKNDSFDLKINLHFGIYAKMNINK